MQPYLQRLLDLDRDMAEAETGLPLYFDWLIRKGHIPQTVTLFAAVLRNLTGLSHSVYRCAMARDMLGAKLVYRALIEQYLRFQYLFVRIYKTADDHLTKRYLDSVNISEWVGCQQVIYLSRKTNDAQAFSLATVWDELISRYPQVYQYTVTEATALMDEFSWEAIVRHLESVKVHDAADHTSFLIHEHAKLVYLNQGGLRLENALQPCEDERLSHLELQRVCEVAFDVTAGAKMLCCHLYELYHVDFKILNSRLSNVVCKLKAEGDSPNSQE